MLKKPLSLVLGLLAIGVLLHFVFTPFYEELVNTGRMWDIINWFMAVGVILTLAVTCARRKSTGNDGQGTNGQDTNGYFLRHSGLLCRRGASGAVLLELVRQPYCG